VGEPGLELGEGFALVWSESGDVDEADHIVSCAGGGDHRTSIGVTNQENRPVDLTDHALEVLAVPAAQASQRIWGSDDRHVLAAKLVVQAAKAGSVSERAVDKNDGWYVGHASSIPGAHVGAPCNQSTAGERSRHSVERLTRIRRTTERSRVDSLRATTVSTASLP
jgi:hypothetical protein